MQETSIVNISLDAREAALENQMQPAAEYQTRQDSTQRCFKVCHKNEEITRSSDTRISRQKRLLWLSGIEHGTGDGGSSEIAGNGWQGPWVTRSSWGGDGQHPQPQSAPFCHHPCRLWLPTPPTGVSTRPEALAAAPNTTPLWPN